MSSIPSGLRFLKSHEWARLEPDGRVTVGISDYAQSKLGDLVYVELPEIGRTVAAGEACAVVESVKAASDVYAPVGGTVVEVNSALADQPERINSSPYQDGWLYRLESVAPEHLEALLDADAYAEWVAAAEA